MEMKTYSTVIEIWLLTTLTECSVFCAQEQSLTFNDNI